MQSLDSPDSRQQEQSHSSDRTRPIFHGVNNEPPTKHRRRHSKVQFLIGPKDDEDGDNGGQEMLEERTRDDSKKERDWPRIKHDIHADDVSQDVTTAMNTQVPAAWRSQMARTAQLQAQDQASGLAYKESFSAPASRRNSAEHAGDDSVSEITLLKPAKATQQSRHPAIRSIASSLWPKPRAERVITGIQQNWQRLAHTDTATFSWIPLDSSSPQRPNDSRRKEDVVPMVDLEDQSTMRKSYSLHADSSDEDSDIVIAPQRKRKYDTPGKRVRNVVRTVLNKFRWDTATGDHQPSDTGASVANKRFQGDDRCETPNRYHQGILASLMGLYAVHGVGPSLRRNSASSNLDNPPFYPPVAPERPPIDVFGKVHLRTHSGIPSSTPDMSGPALGKATPRRKPKWYDRERSQNVTLSARHRSRSAGSLSYLLNLSSTTVQTAESGARPPMRRSKSSGTLIAEAVERIRHPSQIFKSSTQSGVEEAHSIKLHIAAVISRQKYLIKLCRALMIFGAPTHRLESYMCFSARALQIDGQFLYLPGCMFVSFDDPVTHTTEVKLVKEQQGVDLGKFKDTFTVYKNVIHEVWNAEEARGELDEIMKRPAKFTTWIRILVYGIASMSVGPFAFGARPIDFPVTFLLGCILGILQLVVAPKSDEFQHVFEVAAAVITSFLARALGSIRYRDDHLFCFSAMAQSSIALILPGYIILCAALELQSRNLVAGSVRMVYAIIYALFLGFGITIGTAVFGLMYSHATQSVTCTAPWYWQNPYWTHWPFVPLFTLCLIVINQAKWRQAPVMLLISFAGYTTNFWFSKRLANNVQGKQIQPLTFTVLS